MIVISNLLYSYLSLDVWVRIVLYQCEIIVLEIKDIVSEWIQYHLRKRTRLTGKLQLNLLQMVVVDVRIAQGMYEIACLQAGYLRHHLEQQGIGGDVERYAKENVGTTLVELEAQLTVGNIKLEEGMTWRQSHIFQVGHIPRAYDNAS